MRIMMTPKRERCVKCGCRYRDQNVMVVKSHKGKLTTQCRLCYNKRLREYMRKKRNEEKLCKQI